MELKVLHFGRKKVDIFSKLTLHVYDNIIDFIDCDFKKK